MKITLTRLHVFIRSLKSKGFNVKETKDIISSMMNFLEPSEIEQDILDVAYDRIK